MYDMLEVAVGVGGVVAFGGCFVALGAAGGRKAAGPGEGGGPRRIEAEESVVAVLTGHLLKDPDYVIHYHRNMLRAPHHSADGSQQERSLNGAFRNPPARLQATKGAILDHLSRAAEEAKADGPKLD